MNGIGPLHKRAVFIDKDGTLVTNVPYNVDPALLEFTQGALEGLRLLAEHGYRLVVVTNQPGIALGRFDRAALSRLQQALAHRLAEHGVVLDGFYACPHAPGLGCGCRKPEAGLLLKAAAALKIDLSRSWMVGDILDDVEAGVRAGCRTVLLDVGNETEWRLSDLRIPHHHVKGLWQAACAIVDDDSCACAEPPVARVPAESP